MKSKQKYLVAGLVLALVVGGLALGLTTGGDDLQGRFQYMNQFGGGGSQISSPSKNNPAAGTVLSQPDTEAPQLLQIYSTTPDGAYTPPGHIDIYAQFDEELDYRRTAGITVRLSNGATDEFQITQSNSDTMFMRHDLLNLGGATDTDDLTIVEVVNVRNVYDELGNELTSLEIPVGENLGDNADIEVYY